MVIESSSMADSGDESDFASAESEPVSPLVLSWNEILGYIMVTS